MKRIATKYVAMNPRRCVACWECVEKCPKHVIGKVCFLWHKHAVFKDADACIGCNKCVKTCPHGVFFPIELRSEKVRNIIGTIPLALVRRGVAFITIIFVILLLVALLVLYS